MPGLDLSVVGKALPPQTFTYTWKDTALYALGVGAKKEELDYLYEGRGPKVLPSFVVVPMFRPMLDGVVATGGNLAMVVHGKQRVQLHAELAPEGTLSTTGRVRGIYDMRKFAIVIVDCEMADAAGRAVAVTSSQIIIRNAGGFDGEPPPKEEKVADVPKGQAPDFRVEEKTSAEQALLYRLSGDVNPLHADPEFAARVGFAQGPILHGLCTFGYMVRHVAKAACGGDASRLAAFETKFTKPVWPGETLVTEGWNVAPGKIALQVKSKEREEAVCTASWATTRT
jgi:acyl dehydratase